MNPSLCAYTHEMCRSDLSIRLPRMYHDVCHAARAWGEYADNRVSWKYTITILGICFADEHVCDGCET